MLIDLYAAWKQKNEGKNNKPAFTNYHCQIDNGAIKYQEKPHHDFMKTKVEIKFQAENMLRLIIIVFIDI